MGRRLGRLFVLCGLLASAGCGGAGGGQEPAEGLAVATVGQPSGGVPIPPASGVLGSGGGSGPRFKVAHWNVMSGYGKAGWQGSCGFTPGSNCSANAWGGGVLQRTLLDTVKHDPAVVALTLNEAWSCATPRRIQALVGFAAVAPATAAGEASGVSILARHGLAGAPEVKALPRCSSAAEPRYVVRAPVYLDAGKTTVAQVFATHWSGCPAEAAATRAFMEQFAGRPRSLTGDLNVKAADSEPIVTLTGSHYVDAWARLHGSAAGATATWNSTYGNPKGSLYKRIDYAFSGDLDPRAMARFNDAGRPGTCQPSDHAGIIVEYGR